MDSYRVEHYANFGSGEPWVARTILQLPRLVDAVPAFGEKQEAFRLAMGEVHEALGMAFEALRDLRVKVAAGAPALELAEAYARLYGHLWRAYKDRFQEAVRALGIDLGFFWAKDAAFERGAQALVEGHPELKSLVDLLRRYRHGFHNALADYRNLYLEHRGAGAEPEMVASFHRLDAAEGVFDDIWRAIEAIVAGLVAANLPAALALAEVPEQERDPARPERFRFVLLSLGDG